MAGRIVQAVLALAAIRVLTSVLPKDQVGLTYLVTSMASYFTLVFVNPLGMYLNRKLHSWHAELKLKSALKTLNTYLMFVALGSIPVVLVAYYFFGVGTGFSPGQITFLIFVNILVNTWFQTLALGLNMFSYQRPFVIANVFTQMLSLMFSVAGVFLLERTAYVWLLGILLAQSMGACFAWLEYRRLVLESSSEEKVQVFKTETLYFCLPIAATTAFMWVQSQSYRLIVESSLGAPFLAILSVGLGVAVSIAGLVESLVNQYFYPAFYAAISNAALEARQSAWHRLFVNAMAVYIPTTLFVVFLGQFVLRVLVSPDFAGSADLIVWGGLIEFFRMTTNIVYAVSQSEMRTKSTILPYGVGACFVLIGLWLAIHFRIEPIHAIPGLLATGGFLVLAVMYGQMKRILTIHLNRRFFGLAFVYSVPFAIGHFITDASNSFLASLTVCGVFGIYLLFVIFQLYKWAQRLHFA